MAEITPITRDQLAKFLPDNDTIRRFEKLFLLAGGTTPANIEIIFRRLDEVSIDANNATSIANMSNDQIEAITQSLELVALAPPVQVGTLGVQQAERVRITGGTIDGTIIGSASPALIIGSTLASLGLLDISSPTAGQIQFPAVQNPSANANTLDDYEESTYVTTANSTFGTITAYTAIGNYTKVGRQVTATVEVSITNNGTGATAIDISLPFASAATYSYAGAGRESVLTGHMLQCLAGPSSSFVRVYKYDGTYPGGTGATLFLTITYNT